MPRRPAGASVYSSTLGTCTAAKTLCCAWARSSPRVPSSPSSCRRNSSTPDGRNLNGQTWSPAIQRTKAENCSLCDAGISLSTVRVGLSCPRLLMHLATSTSAPQRVLNPNSSNSWVEFGISLRSEAAPHERDTARDRHSPWHRRLLKPPRPWMKSW